ncbi:OmpA family protein [Alkalispirochaeta americana]|uniref:OmpA family protein n=1 Tax=Alkalispirochaeta americana TaxID=159291 RepID=A0A1N6VPE5_9SPIO|nr:OmpA family protein [Alkalispirochaeta americana]SIQ79679.1 OmpA family protein [Alkalispirochaeta americana]
MKTNKRVLQSAMRPGRIFLVLLLGLAVAGVSFAGGAQEKAPPVLEIPPQPRQFISPENQDGLQDVLQLPFSSLVVPSEDTVIIEYALSVFDGDGNLVFEQRERQQERRGFFGNLFGGEKPRVEIPETLTWDGRYGLPQERLPQDAQEGAFVPDGEYTYQVSIVDDGRNVISSAPFNVTVDNTPPEIGEFPPLEYTIFAPNGDGLRDDISFELQGSRELRWIVRIVDDQDDLVFEKVVENETPRRMERDVPPPARFTWDGTRRVPGEEDRARAPEGTYRLVLRGEDRAGNVAEETHPQEVTLSLQAAEVVLAPADGNRWFSPNDSGVRDTLVVDINASDPDFFDRWTLEVLSRGQVVRSESGRGAPPEKWNFDGRRQDGSRFPDGTVALRLRGVLKNAVEVQSEPLDVYIDTVPPEAWLRVNTKPQETPQGEPLVFGAGTKGSVAGTLRFERDVSWRFRVSLEGASLLEGDLEEFFAISGLTPRQVGSSEMKEVELVWGGEDLTGRGDAPDGRYELVLEGQDRAGNIGSSRPLRVIKDSSTPKVEITAENRLLVPLSRGDQAGVDYRISLEDTQGVREFSFEIRNDQGRVVRSEYRQRPFERFLWNGVSNGGRVVDDGEYYASVEVVWQNGHHAQAEDDRPVRVERAPDPPKVGITLTPLPFSPDGEGKSDLLTIALDLKAETEILDWKVAIDDPRGRPFKQFEGRGEPPRELSWDGLSESGELVQSAMDYPVRFTVNDSEGHQATAEAVIATDILVMPDGDRLRIRIASIHFAGNTADLFMSDRDKLEQNLQTLRRLAQSLNRYPDRQIVVEGHAAHVYLQSPESIAREQREELLPLSRRRAEEVMKALIILGVDRDRMRVQALGGDRPVVPHEDLDNLWKNRRVEFLLDR